MPAGPDTAAELARPDRLFDGYVFDLDGTIYLGDELLPGASELLAALAALGRQRLFLSNNPTKSPEEYVAKLARLGIPATRVEVLTSLDTMTSWLLRHHPGTTVFPVGEEPLTRALAAAGIRISDDPAEIDVVIASFDRTFDYRKLQIAFDAIRTHGRARLVATNPDRFCPLPGGRGEPDAAAIIGAIEGCTGARCEEVTGKPDPIMLTAALERLKLPASACVMVGDRLATDIRMAIDAGMASALVLTGATTAEMARNLPPGDRPTWVLERIDLLLPDSLRIEASGPGNRVV